MILQHPRESHVPVGTARLAALGLPNLERHVGVEFMASARVRAALANAEAPAVLLFPGEGSGDLVQDAPRGALTLVVVDGTWWQARKILKKNPELLRLPRYALRPSEPSRYRIRREPAEHCISTIEAIVQALTVLEGSESIRSVLAPFEALVEQQLWFAADRSERRHLTRRSKPRARPLPALLRERAHDIVVAYGEANAWPRGTPRAARPEIVHWAAERVFTGQRFEAFIAPRQPLAPAFSHHTGLDLERVMQGESWQSFCRRWQAFSSFTDILCGWGYFSSEVLKSEGGSVSERLDLRHAARRYLHGKAGQVQDCAVLLGEPVSPAWVSGRTGIRLAALTAVARALMRASHGAEFMGAALIGMDAPRVRWHLGF